MADIKPYVDAISKAVYGEEVRGAIINALIKVNDDNNSYQDLKKEVVEAKDKVEEEITSFDEKMQTATEIEQRLSETTSAATQANDDLVTSILSGSKLKNGLDSDIEEAQRLKSEMPDVIQAAGEAKSALEGSVESAGTAKRELDTSRESASSINDTLKQTIQNAGTEKAALDKSRTDAETTKQNLDNSKSAADTSKQNLDKSIRDAGTANTNLNNAVNTANTAKEQIQEVVNSGNTLRTNLETNIQTAEKKISTLTEKNAAAEQNASTLATRNAAAEKNLADLKVAEGKASEILVGVEDIKAYLGYPDTDIVGIQVDYANKSFQRLAGAYGLLGGSDFDKFEMFGGRRRCNLANDGTINAFYGDEGYTEDGSNGQVMVYQPKFYYKVVPLKLERQIDGVGYHLRKANYFVTATPHDGFKLHPAFRDANGNPVDYILLSAFEGSIYDSSAAAFVLNDAQVMDAAADKFCSIAGARPASGVSQNLTRPNIEQMAQNRGTGWHCLDMATASMEQMLMTVELGVMDTQSGIGRGVVDLPWTTGTDTTSSYAAATGATSALGNATGMAAKTTTYEGGAAKEYSTNGKTSISYRGVENFWGNIWKHVYGVNIWGDGSLKGGVPYICMDRTPAESKKDGNYQSAGFTVTNSNGYISAMGYGDPDFDWLFIASECTGNSALPVGDYTYATANLNGYRIALLGGCWSYGGNAGGFCWALDDGVGFRYRIIGGRLVFIPTVKTA